MIDIEEESLPEGFNPLASIDEIEIDSLIFFLKCIQVQSIGRNFF